MRRRTAIVVVCHRLQGEEDCITIAISVMEDKDMLLCCHHQGGRRGGVGEGGEAQPKTTRLDKERRMVYLILFPYLQATTFSVVYMVLLPFGPKEGVTYSFSSAAARLLLDLEVGTICCFSSFTATKEKGHPLLLIGYLV